MWLSPTEASFFQPFGYLGVESDIHQNRASPKDAPFSTSAPIQRACRRRRREAGVAGDGEEEGLRGHGGGDGEGGEGDRGVVGRTKEHEHDPKFTMVLAATQEALEQLEADGGVVDSEHAHVDGELVLLPCPFAFLSGFTSSTVISSHFASMDSTAATPRNRTSPASAFLCSLLASMFLWILEIQEQRGKECKTSKVKSRGDRM
jgi:hypothetical protein